MTEMHSHDVDQDERHLAGLIRQGGAREQPPAAAREAVRAAVRREWQDVVASRARQRRARWSFAAAAAVAGLAVWVTMPLLQAPPAVVAVVARVSGPVEIGNDGLFGRFAPLGSPGEITLASEIRSGPGGRVALQIGETSVRMDENSVIRMAAADRLTLERGAIYIDSLPQSAAGRSRLQVDTPFGVVEHLGTQYETRIINDALRVRVREGRVSVSGPSSAPGSGRGPAIEGAAGEQVTVLRDGAVARQPVARTGNEWAWVGEISPPFDIESRSLSEFLHWVGRETGRDIAFSSPASEQEAARIVLRGSIAGLTPERALEAVLSTTRFGVSETADQLRVDFRTGDR